MLLVRNKVKLFKYDLNRVIVIEGDVIDKNVVVNVLGNVDIVFVSFIGEILGE